MVTRNETSKDKLDQHPLTRAARKAKDEASIGNKKRSRKTKGTAKVGSVITDVN